MTTTTDDEQPKPLPSFDEIKLYPMRELRRRPRPRHLVEGVLVERSMFTIVGPYGSGKTAIGLDLAYRIANALPWCGRETLQGPVCYVAAESADDVLLRSEAWDQLNTGHERDVLVLPREVNLFSQSRLGQPPIPDRTLRQLHEALDVLPEKPVLILFDTYAQCSAGAEESSSRDTTLIVRELQRLRRRYGCAIGLIHHPPHGDSKRERGSSALPGAVDTSIYVERENPPKGKRQTNGVILTCMKARRLSRFDPIRMELVEVPLGDGASSIVAQPHTDAVPNEAQTDHPVEATARTEAQEGNARVFAAACRFGPIRAERLKELVGLSKQGFYSGPVKRLLAAGLLLKTPNGYDVTTSAHPLRRHFAGRGHFPIGTLVEAGEVLLDLRAEDWTPDAPPA